MDKFVDKPNELYVAQPKQRYFHSASADEVLYGGAAGGGKSYAIIWDAVGKALSHRDLRMVVLRRTYPELEKSIIFEFLGRVPDILYHYHKQNKRATFKDTNSSIEFDHCQFEQDVYKFQSAQYDVIYIDELTHWNEFMYRYILSRLRTVKVGIVPQMKCASNPGGVGHQFVRERFINNAIPFEVTQREDPESGARYTTQFIPAKVYDNEYLMRTDYVRGLMRLPVDDRKALLEGDWDSFKGQFFKEFRRDIHVVNPFKVPKEWVRFRVIDWGYRNPTCVLWMTISPARTIYVYKELYCTEKTDEELANTMKEMSKDERISYTIADPSLWSITQYERGESLALRFSSMGVPLIRGDNNRISGASTVHSYLSYDKKDPPSVLFFDNCLNLIRTLPSLVYDQRRPEDVDTMGDDHCLSGDTLVDTVEGQVEIKKLVSKTGELYTVNGWKEKFYNVRKTGVEKVYRVEFEDGKFVDASGDHLFLMEDGNWKRTLDIRSHDMIQSNYYGESYRYKQPHPTIFRNELLPAWKILFKNIKEIPWYKKIAQGSLGIFQGRNPERPSYSSQGWGQGKQQYRKSGVSKDRFPFSFSQFPSDRKSQTGKTGESKNSYEVALDKRGQGVAQKTWERLLEKSQIFSNYLSYLWKRISDGISIKVTVLPPELQTESGSSAKVRKVYYLNTQNVFNLEVTNIHCFSVNGGIIVHNCYDALRYGLMSHPLPNKQQKRKAPPNSFEWAMGEMKWDRDVKSYIGR